MTSALTDHDVDLETQRDTKSKSRTPGSHLVSLRAQVIMRSTSILLLDTNTNIKQYYGPLVLTTAIMA
jgi:hypothetical protein